MLKLNMERWSGKVAIVTGASCGIGASIAEKFVEAGLKVVGLARRAERIEELAKKLAGKPGKLYAVKCDVSKEDDILKAFEWTTKNVGPVSILVNNAGIVQQTNLIDGETEKWKKVLDVNVLGLCIATREAVKIMKANKIDGHIVHISSVAGHSVPNFPGMNVYPASKHAVKALTETLRQEINREGLKIKITSISPGYVRTEIAETNGFVMNDEQKKVLLAENVAILEPEDVTSAVLYVVGTPPQVQVHELIIRPVGEFF